MWRPKNAMAGWLPNPAAAFSSSENSEASGYGSSEGGTSGG